MNRQARTVWHSLIWCVALASVGRGLAAQSLESLPEVDSEAAHAVEWRLWLYYHFSSRGALNISPYQGLCDADRGDLCYEGDHESFCTKLRCNSLKQQAGLVEKLAEIAREYPYSPHAVGHAVYAAVRLGHLGRASELVELCAPFALWWCDLTEGYVLHRSGRSAAAEEPFRRGLSRAPEEIRCRLEDVSALLSGDARSEYDSVACAERGPLHRYVWWLADPFYMDLGNDRWAEHVARRFTLLLHQHRIRVARDLAQMVRLYHRVSHEEEVVRRGFQDSWRLFGRAGGLAEGAGFTSRTGAASHYLPEAFSLEGIDGGVTYRVEATLGDEGYTRRDGPTVEAPAQVARFRDADSLFVALASRLGAVDFLGRSWTDDSRESREDAPPGQAFLVVSDGPGRAASLRPTPIAERATFATSLESRPQMVSLEVFTPAGTARHRSAVVPLDPGPVQLSDLLLFRPTSPDLPTTRMRAIGLMLGETAIPRERTLGVYWEAYGLSGDDPVRVSVRLVGSDVGLLGRIGSIVGLGGQEERGAVSWTEMVDDPDPFRRAITVELDGVEPGTYELVVEMTLPDASTLSSSRRVVVLEDPT